MSRVLIYILATASTLAFHIIMPLWETMDKEYWSSSQVNWTIAAILIGCYVVTGTAICIPWWRCGRAKEEEQPVLTGQDQAREVFTLRVYKDVG